LALVVFGAYDGYPNFTTCDSVGPKWFVAWAKIKTLSSVSNVHGEAIFISLPNNNRRRVLTVKRKSFLGAPKPAK